MNDQRSEPHVYPAVPLYSVSPPEQEKTLLDLYEIVAARWRLVAVAAAACLLLAVVYLASVKPIYRAETFLLRPLPADVELRTANGASLRGLRLEGLRIDAFDPERVFSELAKWLSSRGLRRAFFDEKDLFEIYQNNGEHGDSTEHNVFVRHFNDKLVVHRPGADDDPRVLRVSFEFADPHEAARLLNEFVAQADARAVDALLRDFDSDLNVRVKTLQDMIARERGLAKALHEDKITRLEEAWRIAKSLGLPERSRLTPNVEAPGSEDTIAIVATPLFLRGEKALRSEIDVLKAREDFVAFVPALRELQDELAFLEQLEIDRSSIRASIVDEPAITPENAIWPRKTLVLGAALVGGALLGMGIALVLGLLGRPAESLARADS